jgi:ABC-type transporter MlaC component
MRRILIAFSLGLLAVGASAQSADAPQQLSSTDVQALLNRIDNTPQIHSNARSEEQNETNKGEIEATADRHECSAVSRVLGREQRYFIAT